MRNYAEFGTEVTVSGSAEKFVSTEDKDVAGEVYKILTARKINIITGISVKK